MNLDLFSSAIISVVQYFFAKFGESLGRKEMLQEYFLPLLLDLLQRKEEGGEGERGPLFLFFLFRICGKPPIRALGKQERGMRRRDEREKG